MTLTFRQVLPAVVAVLGRWTGLEFTVLRDVTGKVRLLVECADPKRPTEQEVTDLHGALAVDVGDWLGAATPVWAPKKKEAVAVARLLGTIRTNRRALPGHPGIFVLERHAGREAWTGVVTHDPPWSQASVDAGTKPPILTFFSHKGGVGRTTALVATGLALARVGRKVLLVDLDLEAPGLGSILPGAPGKEGGLDLLVGAPATAADLQAYATSVTDPLLIGSGATLRVLHAGEVDADYIEMLARLDQSAGLDRPGVSARLGALFAAIVEAWPDLDYILVDARAGFHDLGGIMLASLSHGAVVVGTASEQSWLGLRVVARLLANPFRARGEEPVPLVAVHGMAPEVGARGREAELAAFRATLHDCLSEEYYPARDLPPPEERGRPHDALPLPWSAALRGRGGPLDEDTVKILQGQEFTALVGRVTTIFPREVP